MAIKIDFNENDFSGGQRFLLNGTATWLQDYPDISYRLYEQDKEIMDGRYHSWVLEISSYSIELKAFMFSAHLAIRGKEKSFKIDTNEAGQFISTPEANAEVLKEILALLESAIASQDRDSVSVWHSFKGVMDRILGKKKP